MEDTFLVFLYELLAEIQNFCSLMTIFEPLTTILIFTIKSMYTRVVDKSGTCDVWYILKIYHYNYILLRRIKKCTCNYSYILCFFVVEMAIDHDIERVLVLPHHTGKN